MLLWLKDKIHGLQDKVGPPGPKELGMSDRDALGLRGFTPFQKGATWEDWHERVAKEYPVRNFLYEVLGTICTRLYIWWRHYITLRSRLWDKEYLIDVRDADPLMERRYEYGYIDPCEASRLVAWKLFCGFVENDGLGIRNPYDLGMGAEYLEESWHADEASRYHEMQTLYYWWTQERKEEEEYHSDLRVLQDAAVTAGDEESYRRVSKRSVALTFYRERKDQEMFERLAKLRPYLWG